MPATCMAGTSALDGLPEVERSTVRAGMPSAFSRSAMKRSSLPLVSKVPTTSTVRPIRSAKGMAKTFFRSSAGAVLLDRRLPHGR